MRAMMSGTPIVMIAMSSCYLYDDDGPAPAALRTIIILSVCC